MNLRLLVTTEIICFSMSPIIWSIWAVLRFLDLNLYFLMKECTLFLTICSVLKLFIFFESRDHLHPSSFMYENNSKSSLRVHESLTTFGSRWLVHFYLQSRGEWKCVPLFFRRSLRDIFFHFMMPSCYPLNSVTISVKL